MPGMSMAGSRILLLGLPTNNTSISLSVKKHSSKARKVNSDPSHVAALLISFTFVCQDFTLCHARCGLTDSPWPLWRGESPQDTESPPCEQLTRSRYYRPTASPPGRQDDGAAPPTQPAGGVAESPQARDTLTLPDRTSVQMSDVGSQGLFVCFVLFCFFLFFFGNECAALFPFFTAYQGRPAKWISGDDQEGKRRGSWEESHERDSEGSQCRAAVVDAVLETLAEQR